MDGNDPVRAYPAIPPAEVNAARTYAVANVDYTVAHYRVSSSSERYRTVPYVIPASHLR